MAYDPRHYWCVVAKSTLKLARVCRRLPCASRHYSRHLTDLFGRRAERPWRQLVLVSGAYFQLLNIIQQFPPGRLGSRWAGWCHMEHGSVSRFLEGQKAKYSHTLRTDGQECSVSTQCRSQRSNGEGSEQRVCQRLKGAVDEGICQYGRTCRRFWQRWCGHTGG